MGLMAPAPVVPPLTLTYLCGGLGRKGVGKDPPGSSTAPGPEQSLRRGPLWPRGRGQAEGVTHGDKHGAAGLTAMLGAQPSWDPTPGSKCLGNAPGTGGSQHFLHISNRNLWLSTTDTPR